MLSPLLIIWTHSEAAELQVPVEDFRLEQTSPEDGVRKLAVAGEVDLATVGPLLDAAREAVASPACRLIVFDLERVTFMDSSGLHVVADTNRQMRASGRTVEVVCKTPLTRLFAVMGLDRVLTINPQSEAGDLAAA